VLGDLLGRGGMAEVFAGHAVGDHGFQKPVAIKRLLPELANDEVFVERLIEEAKLLVGMQHGNIVSVLDLAREGDDVFLVMEFVDGPSLRQLIKARGARGLSLGVATYIVQSAAAGLEFAHARPGGAIIHADISPSNLLLTTSGEVRVADFGIARREGLGHGVVEGKWAYMAPEQARGEALTPRSDVFALGVVLYELLTGQHPFGRAVTANERDDQMQVIPPRVVKSSIPPGLDAICMRALAHNPRDRSGRMQQLIDALVEERFSNGYRDGASDLAQAIREVAPRSEIGSPRTMHTDRPVTIVTRSLLREVTPARRSSTPSQRPPSDPPPSEQFPAVGTMAVATMELPAELPPSDQFPPVGTMGVATMALPIEAPMPDQFPMVPTSGAQTVIREADQIALAQAAAAAAAMLEIPAVLRADGTPMPPFRLSQGDVRGDELASVVGGNTFTGHAAVPIEPRSHRLTISILAAATLLGVGAAVAIQLGHARADEPPVPPSRTQPVTRPADEAPPAPAVEPSGTQEARDTAPVVPARPAIQPTIQDSPQAAGSPGVATVARSGGAAGDNTPSTGTPDNGAADNGAAGNGAADNAAAGNGIADNGAAGNGAAGNGAVGNGVADSGAAGNGTVGAGTVGGVTGTAGTATAGTATAGTATGKTSKSGKTGSSGKRVASKDGAKRRTAPGILQVDSEPWSWVTVDIETKETPTKFYLPPGTHTVKFYNEVNGVTRYETIEIESDVVTKINEPMRR
jgi:serine/threonine protein kinase